MSMLLDDPETQKIIAENKQKSHEEFNDGSESKSDKSESDSDGERPVLLLKYKPTKSTKNISV